MMPLLRLKNIAFTYPRSLPLFTNLSFEIFENEKEGKKDILSNYTIELTEKARKYELDPLIGRDEILGRTVQVLSRRLKNNPIHVGEPGVGSL